MPKTGMEPIRRKQVTDAVLRCIADEGIDQVTLDKTAKIAGVSKGVVAYYFRNKENLLIESVKGFLNSYLEISDADITTTQAEMTAKGFLLFIGQSTLGLLSDKGGLSQADCKKIMMQLYSRVTVSSEYRGVINDVYNQYFKAVIEVLEYGNKTGEFTIPDTENTAIQLMALLDGFVFYSVIRFRGSDEDHFNRYKSYVESL